MSAEVSILELEWIPLEEATAKIRKSARTIERLMHAGHLRSRLEPRARSKPQRMYHAGDLDRIQKESIPAPAVEPQRALVRKAPALGQQLAIPPDAVTAMRDMLAGWRNQVSAREKLWLSLREASMLSGLSRKYLRRACEQKTLEHIKDGRSVRVRRTSLEAFAG